MDPAFMPIPMRYTVAADAPIKFEFANPQEFAEWLDRVRPPVVQPSSALRRGEAAHLAAEAALRSARSQMQDVLAENRRLQIVAESHRIGAKGLVEDLAKEKARLDAVVTQNQELRAVARAHGEARDRAEKDLAAVLAALRAKDVVAACEIASKAAVLRDWGRTLARAVLNSCTAGSLTVTAVGILDANSTLDNLQKGVK
jgi:exonuclease VII small subunit